MHRMNRIYKPNFTAWFVLQGTIVAMRQPALAGVKSDLPVDQYYVLSRAAAKTRLLARVISALPYSLQYRIGEWVTNKGRLRHYFLRKKTIAAWVRQCISQDHITQCVVLGAGLDALSAQLVADFPHLACIEIDVAESQHFKQTALMQAGMQVDSGIEYLSADLRNPLPGVLAQSAVFSAEKKTLWLAEGLFMFLPEADVVRMLREIKHLSPMGSQVIFTALPIQHQGTAVSKWIQKLYLKHEKTPVLWALPREALHAFVDKLGYIHRQTLTYDALPESHNLPKFDNIKQVGEDIHRLEVIE